MRRVVPLAVVALGLLAPSSAFALHRDQTVTSGQTTAVFSFDYKKTQYGLYDFSGLRVTIDRGGQRLVDFTGFGDTCRGCSAWPAGGTSTGSLTVRDLDGDGEPEVLVDLYSGGANCCWYTESWRYDEVQNAYIEKQLRPGQSFPYVLKDLNGDGVPEFRTVDYRFAYKYGSNVDTPRPLRIFDWDGGRLVDVTIAYPKLAARDAAQYWRLYLELRPKPDLNVRGVLAAYLADSYRAGNGRAAWKRVVAAYRRGDVDKKIPGDTGAFGARYLKSLRSFLKKLGYLRRA